MRIIIIITIIIIIIIIIRRRRRIVIFMIIVIIVITITKLSVEMASEVQAPSWLPVSVRYFNFSFELTIKDGTFLRGLFTRPHQVRPQAS